MNHHMHPYMRAARMQQMADERYEQEMNRENNDLPMTEDEQRQEEAREMAGEAPAEEAQEAESRHEEAPAEPSEEEKKRIEDMRLRMAAEMDNFKKRLTREHQEQMRYASEKVLSDLLPALDNLDLAIQYGSTHEACKDMMQGIEMTRKQLLDAVTKSGLERVGAIGEEFNPEIHEAIGYQENPELQKGAVSNVMQTGYKLNGRLLRPAKVMVNN